MQETFSPFRCFAVFLLDLSKECNIVGVLKEERKGRRRRRWGKWGKGVKGETDAGMEGEEKGGGAN